MRRQTVETQRLYVAVGDCIKDARVGRRIPLLELARRVGVTPLQMQRVEDAEVQCSLHMLVALAEEFDVSLDALVPILIDEGTTAR